MINKGLRRTFFSQEICSQCGETRLKKYLRHPFSLPESVGRGHWLFSDCACIKKERSKERSDRVKFLSVQAANHPLPVGLRQHTFATFRVTEFNGKPVEVCQRFVNNFSKNEKGEGLLIFGRAGTGKTHLAAAIANSLKDKYTVAFAYMPILLEKMRSTNVPLEPLLSADLLILDDIGSERETGWTMERLLIIVDGRLTNLKPTVFTTNYDLGDLDKRVGMRAASRILGHNLQLHLLGPDWRQVRVRV